jgi:broad specificity phosphatase PhoE
MPRVQLPETVASAPFTFSTGVEAGLGRGRLRGPDLERPTRALRSPVALGDVRARAAAFALVLPSDGAFSHVTAAQLWGLPLPRELEQQVALDVMRNSDRGPVRRAGCIGHRGLERRTTDLVAGVEAVDLADTWCDLGEVLDRGLDVDDLVVMGDVVVRRLGTNGRARLESALDQRRRPRGKAALQSALVLVRAGSRSPMETRVRLVFLAAGFPEPRLNAAVRDQAGGWLLEGDLVWEKERVVGEYQGEQHAALRQRAVDAQRRHLAEDAGWTVLEIFHEDVVRPARRHTLLQRFARALGLPAEGVPVLEQPSGSSSGRHGIP